MDREDPRVKAARSYVEWTRGRTIRKYADDVLEAMLRRQPIPGAPVGFPPMTAARIRRDLCRLLRPDEEEG